MKANKRIRDLSRLSPRRLVTDSPTDGVTRGTTTHPFLSFRNSRGWDKYASGKATFVEQDKHPHIRITERA